MKWSALKREMSFLEKFLCGQSQFSTEISHFYTEMVPFYEYLDGVMILSVIVQFLHPRPNFDSGLLTKVEVRKPIWNIFGELPFIRSDRFVLVLSRIASIEFVLKYLQRVVKVFLK